MPGGRHCSQTIGGFTPGGRYCSRTIGGSTPGGRYCSRTIAALTPGGRYCSQTIGGFTPGGRYCSRTIGGFTPGGRRCSRTIGGGNMFSPALQCRDMAPSQHKGGVGLNPRRLLILSSLFPALKCRAKHTLLPHYIPRRLLPRRLAYQND